VRNEYEDRIPSDLLAIGMDASGNQLCLGVHAELSGQMYLWDHEDSTEDPRFGHLSERRLLLIAPSFEDFLAGLRFDEGPVVASESIDIFQRAARGDLSALKEALELGADVNCRNERRQTLLMVAARERQPAILERGANVDAIDREGKTALMHAIDRCSDRIAKILIAHGANVNVRSRSG